ncbi:MAG: exodeoxyribonuclease III [Candidatus Pacearchaeota archaeon]
MKIISWNVNGIRAAIKKGFFDFVKKENPEIICIQETKAHPEQVEHEMEDLGYKYEYWNSAEKKGYSGVAIFSKIKPLSESKGIKSGSEADSEGRVLTLEFEDFYLVTVYTPNSKDDLSRIPLRYKKWDPGFLEHCKKLEKKKPVIFCGDLNVAHEPIDLKNDKANEGKKGYTREEREGFFNFVKNDFIDTFRHFYPDEEKYSWWATRFGPKARINNVGWRIDYFLASNKLIPRIKKAFILNEIMGSDHCPVGIELK